MEPTGTARAVPGAAAWIAGAAFAVAAAVVAQPPLALAQTAPEGGGVRAERLLLMLDQNGDGVLDHEEFVETPRPGGAGVSDAAQRSRAAQFDQLDQDGDGVLSEEELAELSGVRVR
jgi:hypothetical protein